MKAASETSHTFLAAQVIALFNEVDRHRLNLNSARTFLYIAGMTMHPDNPNLPTISEIAAVVGLTVSGASRIASALSKELGLIIIDKGVEDPRSGAVYLTEKGKRIFEDLVSNIYPGDNKEYCFFDRAGYIEAKFLKRRGNFRIFMKSYNPKTCEMRIAPIDESLRTEIEQWIADFERDFCVIEEEESSLVLRFAGKAEAVQFRLRWGAYDRG